MIRKLAVLLMLSVSFQLQALDVYLNDQLWRVYNQEEMDDLTVLNRRTGEQFIAAFDLFPLVQNEMSLSASSTDGSNFIQVINFLPDSLIDARLIQQDEKWFLKGFEKELDDVASVWLYGEPVNEQESLLVWLSQEQTFISSEIQNFASLHNLNITIEIQPDIDAALDRRYLNQQSFPDLIISSSEEKALYSKQSIFEPAIPRVKEQESTLGSFYQFAPEHLKEIAYPILFSYQCLLYNADILKPADLQGRPFTFSQLENVIKKIRPYAEVPLAWDVGQPEGFMPFINNLSSREALSQAFNFVQQLFNEGTLSRLGSDGLNTRTTAMLLASSLYATEINPQLVDLRYLALPQETKPYFTYFIGLIPQEASTNLGKILALSLWSDAAQYRMSDSQGLYANRLSQVALNKENGEEEALKASMLQGRLRYYDPVADTQIDRLSALLSLVTKNLISTDKAMDVYFGPNQSQPIK